MPSTYKKYLILQPQRLRQGSKSVEEFRKEKEMLIIESELEESAKARMVRLLNDLNQDIQDVVELQQHENLEDVLHNSMKVERKLKRCLAYQNYAFWNSFKDKKEEDKSLQGKSSRPSSSKDSKHSSSSKDHVSSSSSLKSKFEKKKKFHEMY